MRRWILLPAAVLVIAGAACSQGKDGAGGRDTGVETRAPEVDLADAVAVAQRSMPVALPDSRVGILIEDLCAAGAGDAGEVAAGLGGVSFADAAQLEAALASLQAGADDFCPDEVDPAVVEALRAAGAPPAPSSPAAATGSGSAGATSEAATGSSGAGDGASSGATSNASGSSSGSPSGAANSSSGSASTGGGNATGTGNSSSTDFSQTVGSGSSGSSSAGDGASSTGSAGTP